MFEQKLSLRWSGEWEGVLLWRQPAPGLELETNLHEVLSFIITEKAPTRVIRDRMGRLELCLKAARTLR